MSELFSKSDGDNNRHCNMPHESADAANDALKKFSDELYELRTKYQIANVAFVISDNYKTPDGEETTCHVTGMFGDGNLQESLFAIGLGHAQATRQHAISELLNQAYQKPKSRK